MCCYQQKKTYHHKNCDKYFLFEIFEECQTAVGVESGETGETGGRGEAGEAGWGT
jgi:hypothetical protein